MVCVCNTPPLAARRRVHFFLRRSAGLACLVAVILVQGLPAQAADAARPPAAPVELDPTDRVLVLAPHPDDEVLACGGILQRAGAMGLPRRVVFFTYGDNNEWSFWVYRRRPVLTPKATQAMGLIRHHEALAASRILGLSPTELTFLGYPDFGTLAIWNAHWGARPAYRSMLTRVTAVPYPNALRPGASYKGEEILVDLTAILREFRPTKIFLPHPADQMPDHCALYLFTQVALWQLEQEMQPHLYPYLIHFQRWPTPSGYHLEEPLNPPSLLPPLSAWHAFSLTPQEVLNKQKALEAHRSQYQVRTAYLSSFVRTCELFGDSPPIHLAVPPSPTTAAASSVGPVRVPVAPEQLTNEERAAFVGVELNSVRADAHDLIVSVSFSRPLATTVDVAVSIFGYRSDRPFGMMPKWQLRLGALTEAIYDQDQRRPSELVHVTREPHQITCRIARSTLGDPHQVFISARSSLGEVPLDWSSWRIIVLDGADSPPAPVTSTAAPSTP